MSSINLFAHSNCVHCKYIMEETRNGIVTIVELIHCVNEKMLVYTIRKSCKNELLWILEMNLYFDKTSSHNEMISMDNDILRYLESSCWKILITKKSALEKKHLWINDFW